MVKANGGGGSVVSILLSVHRLVRLKNQNLDASCLMLPRPQDGESEWWWEFLCIRPFVCSSCCIKVADIRILMCLASL